MSPKVSVVMSVYNGERYLRAAIDSILNQTFSDFEFIIVDDGSVDLSADVVRSYKDSRIRFFKQENSGLAAALNRSIELAKGEYIARMDADDISHPSRLQVQYDYMRAHPDVDILGAQAYLIDQEGVVIGNKSKPVKPASINTAIEYGCPLIHPTYFVKTEVYRKLGGYRVSFTVGQDYDFLLRAVDLGATVANTDEYLLSYRVDTGLVRPGRDRHQMRVSRIAIKAHRQRLAQGREDSDLLKKVRNGPVDVTPVFSLAYKWRRTLMIRAKDETGLKYLLTMFSVVLVSLVDYELFCSSLRGLLYKRACVEH